MVASAAELDGTAMSWEDFDALGEIRAEYIDGRLLMAPSPMQRHQRASRLLATLLDSVLKPGYEVDEAWSWKPGRDEFVPDILVYPSSDEQVRFTGTPVLVVEILSTSPTRDLVVKMNKYARYKLDRYWVLDPDLRELHVYVRHGSAFVLEQTVGAEPTEVDFGAGVVRIEMGSVVPAGRGQ